MRGDSTSLLRLLLRIEAGHGPHAELARRVVLAVLLARLVAGAAHDGPPHAARRAPLQVRAKRVQRLRRGSVAGRRPRG